MNNPNVGYRAALSVSEVVTSSGLSKAEVYKAIKSGELPAKKRGRRTLVLAEDFAAFLNNLPNAELSPVASSKAG